MAVECGKSFGTGKFVTWAVPIAVADVAGRDRPLPFLPSPMTRSRRTVTAV